MLRLFVTALCLLLAAPAAANVVSGMRLVGDAERTRFVVDLEKSPDFNVLRLANPNRLVIDLPELEFADSAAAAKGRGLVSDYRYGLIALGKARIVLDLSAPVEIVNTFVLDPVAPEPARLVIDLVPASQAEFEAAAREDRPQRVEPGRAPVDLVPGRETGRPVVVIDPGHGGIDSGATGEGGLVEKDITLEFGLELARQLRLGAELEPMLTRDGDAFLSLIERVEIARRRQAALFIALHADTVNEEYVRGATVYTLSEDASDAMSAAVAERENRSDILAGLAAEDQPDEVVDILFDLARRETRNLSVRFAKTLVDDMDGEVPLNSNPWRRASFKVLTAPDVPSVLLELGYLSNPDDEKLFRSPDWPRNKAEIVARAIEDFFGAAVTAGQ